MEQKNGYFQIRWMNKTAVCRIFAPKEEGVPVSYKELASFLSSQGIYGYSEADVAQAVAQGTDCEIMLAEGDGIEFSGSMELNCSLDKMKITAVFYPPSAKGSPLSYADIMAELKGRGVKHGIKGEVISAFLQEPVYCTPLVLAEGKQPLHGKDARIEYYFNTNPSLKPKHNEDGSVDYHSLNMICHVEKGDKLATLHPMEPGEPGVDVFGKTISPRTVKNRALEYGMNISLSEDGLELFSDVTGHVALTDGKAFVSSVYEVPADVDNSTGDIRYNGNVHVAGSVRGGFTLIADGDIVVEGSVEDALLQAGGNIIVRCGIQGMHRGVVEAQGNIITKYIENAKVFAGGYVESGSIIYSEVSAGEDIIVAERKGFINGGVIRAGGKVDANSIGSQMGAKTQVEVGIAPEKKERYANLQKEIAGIGAEQEKIAPILEKYNALIQAGQQLEEKHRQYYQQLLHQRQTLQQQKKEAEEEFQALHKEMTNSRHAKVLVHRDIFPGTVISISELSVTVKDKRSYTCIERKNGEIQFNNL